MPLIQEWWKRPQKSEYLQRITRSGRSETGELADFPLNWQFRRKKSGAIGGVCLCGRRSQFMVGSGLRAARGVFP